MIASLGRLGFTQYEAQAYVALVGQAPITGAEVGRRASMPPSKIYETLTRLEARGAVLVHRSDPVLYAAVPHKALLGGLKSRFDEDVEAAVAALNELPTQQEPGLVWSVTGRAPIVSAFERTISASKHSIFAGIWDEEIDELGPALEAAAARGVDAHVAIYGTRKLNGPQVYDMAECGASARLRMSGRRLAVLVADDKDAVVAQFGAHSPHHATLTTNPVMALLAVEYIKADVTGQLLINGMTAASYKKLRETPAMRGLLRPMA